MGIQKGPFQQTGRENQAPLPDTAKGLIPANGSVATSLQAFRPPLKGSLQISVVWEMLTTPVIIILLFMLRRNKKTRVTPRVVPGTGAAGTLGEMIAAAL